VLTKEVHDRTDDGRQTGADDADFALEAAPERDRVVVVGCVGVFSELRDVLQAHHTAGRDEETDYEDHHDGDLAPGVVNRKAQQLRNWEEEHHEVEGDVESAVGVDTDLGRGALALVLAIPLCPVQADRPACDAKGDDEASAVDDQGDDDAVADVRESP